MYGLFFKKIISFATLAAFLVSGVPSSYAQVRIPLPPAGDRVSLSAKFDPALMVGVQLDVNDPFKFNFLIDRGQNVLSASAKSEEYKKLIKYFLASLTTPNNDMWVNLSPFEQERIIPDNFGLTEMGRDLLSQDYLLKQITSSLIYPEGDIGKKFWQEIYQKVAEKYGTTDIPLDTFNKVWIIPDKAVIFQKDGTALSVESHLKVMLESDYVAMSNNGLPTGGHAAPFVSVSPSRLPSDEPLNMKATQVSTESQALVKDIVREIVIPALEKEINEGENFAPLRQIYSAMLMATWFKKTLRQSILGRVYADRSKVAGVEINDAGAKERIYQQYLQAYKTGVFNFIREEEDPLTRETIPRKYFSGGTKAFDESQISYADQAQAKDFAEKHKNLDRVQTKLGKAAKTKSLINNMDRAQGEALSDWGDPEFVQDVTDLWRVVSQQRFIVDGRNFDRMGSIYSEKEKLIRELKKKPGYFVWDIVDMVAMDEEYSASDVPGYLKMKKIETTSLIRDYFKRTFLLLSENFQARAGRGGYVVCKIEDGGIAHIAAIDAGKGFPLDEDGVPLIEVDPQTGNFKQDLESTGKGQALGLVSGWSDKFAIWTQGYRWNKDEGFVEDASIRSRYGTVVMVQFDLQKDSSQVVAADRGQLQLWGEEGYQDQRKAEHNPAYETVIGRAIDSLDGRRVEHNGVAYIFSVDIDPEPFKRFDAKIVLKRVSDGRAVASFELGTRDRRGEIEAGYIRTLDPLDQNKGFAGLIAWHVARVFPADMTLVSKIENEETLEALSRGKDFPGTLIGRVFKDWEFVSLVYWDDNGEYHDLKYSDGAFEENWRPHRDDEEGDWGFVEVRFKAGQVRADKVRPMTAAPGGIDLNDKNLDLKVDGKLMGMGLPAEWRGVDLNTIDGLSPVIVNIAPVTGLTDLLGLSGV